MSIRRQHLLTLLSAALLVLLAHRAVAQISTTPYLSKEGISAGLKIAKDSIGSDAQLISIIAPGNLNLQGINLEFNPVSGKASIWAYLFYSPTTQKTTLIAVAKIILFYQGIGLGNFPLPIALPTSGAALNVDATYSNSDKMAEQLRTDSGYQEYVHRLPEVFPNLVTYGQLLASLPVQLPIGFPTEEPIWTVMYTGGGDSSMTCFVSGETGQTFCANISLPTGAVPEVEGSASRSITAAPNPASDRVRLSLPDGMGSGGFSAALFNSKGDRVMELTEAFARNDFRFVEIDTRTLAPGTYRCRVDGSGWSSTAGVVVVR